MWHARPNYTQLPHAGETWTRKRKARRSPVHSAGCCATRRERAASPSALRWVSPCLLRCVVEMDGPLGIERGVSCCRCCVRESCVPGTTQAASDCCGLVGKHTSGGARASARTAEERLCDKRARENGENYKKKVISAEGVHGNVGMFWFERFKIDVSHFDSPDCASFLSRKAKTLRVPPILYICRHKVPGNCIVHTAHGYTLFLRGSFRFDCTLDTRI